MPIRINADNVVIAVGDSGEGLDSANIDRVFDAFFTTKPDGDGNGTGNQPDYYRVAWRTPLGHPKLVERSCFPVYFADQRERAP